MISSQFSDSKSLPYRLYAVFIHSGSVSFGHYWIYIFDFERNVWRKYNDEYVTEVQDLSEIFGNSDRPNPPTPYFLVYVHDGIKTRLVDPVQRLVRQEEPPPLPARDEGPSDSKPDTAAVGAPTSEDIDMNPPAYDEVMADKDASGTDYIAEKGKGTAVSESTRTDVSGGTWTANQTDSRDVQW